MGIEVTSVGSSSSGNSYIIRSKNNVVILDVGLSGKKIKEGLSTLGIAPADVDAIMVTHEHVDHVKSIRLMAKTCANADVITSRGTYEACDNMKDIAQSRIQFVRNGDELSVGDINVDVFALSHDAAEPVGYALESGGERLCIVTDTGMVTEAIREELVAADKLVFESNYEEDLLLMGPYPYSVKRRILGDHGHLSNELAGTTLTEILNRRKDSRQSAKAPRIMLAHISTTNNTPSQARHTVESIMKKSGHNGGADYHMIVAAKEGVTKL